MPLENPQHKTRKRNFYAWTSDPMQAYEMILDLAFQFARHDDLPKPWPKGELTPELAMRELERVVAHWAFGEYAIPGITARMLFPKLGPLAELPRPKILERMSQIPKDNVYWQAHQYAVKLYRATYHSAPKTGRPRKLASQHYDFMLELRDQGKSYGQIAREMCHRFPDVWIKPKDHSPYEAEKQRRLVKHHLKRAKEL